MPASPRPLWNGYDDANEDDLLALLDDTAKAADDPDDPTVHTDVSGGLATAIARHESIKHDLDDPGYRPRLHARASELAGSWKP